MAKSRQYSQKKMLSPWLQKNLSEMDGGSPAAWARSSEAIAGGPAAASDAELLARVRQYDEVATLELYDRYQASVFRFVLHMSGDANVAADITQEVFLLMLQGVGVVRRVFSRFDPYKGNLEAYLLGVARRLTRKLTAKQNRYLPLDETLELSSTLATEAEMESRFLLARLRSAIHLLPSKYREVIVLCSLGEKSYDETAAIIGCSVGTVASRLSRARRLLSQRLAEEPSKASYASRVRRKE